MHRSSGESFAAISPDVHLFVELNDLTPRAASDRLPPKGAWWQVRLCRACEQGTPVQFRDGPAAVTDVMESIFHRPLIQSRPLLEINARDARVEIPREGEAVGTSGVRRPTAAPDTK